MMQIITTVSLVALMEEALKRGFMSIRIGPIRKAGPVELAFESYIDAAKDSVPRCTALRLAEELRELAMINPRKRELQKKRVKISLRGKDRIICVMRSIVPDGELIVGEVIV
jgi:hypothetical protein